MQQDLALQERKKLNIKDKIHINIYEIASVLVTALIAIAFLFTFVFRVVGVSGISMQPTLNDGDWLIVSAADFEPEYGQVIIITQPNAYNEPIVKRIIATEYQTVDINFTTGEVFVDGVVLDEPYINNETTTYEGVEFPLVVPEGYVFVMGDNRQHSSDSRSPDVGLIDEDYILGVVKYKVFSVNEITGAIELNDFADMPVDDLQD
ncbi:MAG: signal peptidase I [Clostridia bacterium]